METGSETPLPLAMVADNRYKILTSVIDERDFYFILTTMFPEPLMFICCFGYTYVCHAPLVMLLYPFNLLTTHYLVFQGECPVNNVLVS